ncbi:cell division ATP-binding protein FtsE [Thermodesulfatator autotrophicus]|uniref:Cell division ATP-binding protein FtsE n=1 Tax=Thermodesulfatator autotrophicus TaxID=1795632 RepID=A0A177E984_9BACT|nr:cell division ATP-binding protein FtsE [Thermodesulfatator autotrophicus]
MLRLERVSKVYKPNIRALEDISFRVAKGEFIFITGPSGSGKSTLLNLIFRAEKPTSGEIFFEGRPLSSFSRKEIPYLRRKIGFVFQDFKLLENRTVFENVAISLEIQDIPEGEIKYRVLKILKRLGLEGKESQLVRQLSGGEKQRVALARAVINRPRLLLADEPTGNLDARRTEEVMEIFEDLNAEGTTIILATHDQSLFVDSHRRVLVLDEGRLLNP